MPADDRRDDRFVERVVTIAREMGRKIATPEEAREILHLPSPPAPRSS